MTVMGSNKYNLNFAVINTNNNSEILKQYTKIKIQSDYCT